MSITRTSSKQIRFNQTSTPCTRELVPAALKQDTAQTDPPNPAGSPEAYQ